MGTPNQIHQRTDQPTIPPGEQVVHDTRLGFGRIAPLVIATALLVVGLRKAVIGNMEGISDVSVHTMQIDERTREQRRRMAEEKKCLFDEGVTENVLCGGNAEVAQQFAGPLVEFDMCGHKERTGFLILMRKQCAEVVWKINQAMLSETGKCIRLTGESPESGRPHLRTNDEQRNAYLRYTTGLSGIAAPPTKGNHEGGCALDVINYKDVEKFALQLGWSIGPRNCIADDPVHLSPKPPCDFMESQKSKFTGGAKKLGIKLKNLGR